MGVSCVSQLMYLTEACKKDFFIYPFMDAMESRGEKRAIRAKEKRCFHHRSIEIRNCVGLM